MTLRLDGTAAVLSLLYPGCGQLSQGRRGPGWVQFWWATLALLTLYLAPAFGSSRLPFAIELALVGVWSVVDAAIRAPRAQRAA